MHKWKRFPRVMLLLALLIGMLAGVSAPALVNESVSAAPLAACPDPMIIQWTFAGDVVTPSTGTGTFGSGSGLNPSTPPPYTFVAGDPDRAVSFTSWNTPALDEDAYVEFRVDTTGRSSITVDFDYRRSPTGPLLLQIRYSTDGSTFIDFGSAISVASADTWLSQNVNFSSVPALDNIPSAAFRIYGYSTSSSTGTLRFDN